MTEQAISPLRRRMIEDMAIRKFAQKTQHDYVQRVKDFASYLKRSPDTAKPEDVPSGFVCAVAQFFSHCCSARAQACPMTAEKVARGSLPRRHRPGLRC
jgi:hypothetical protein